MSATGVEAVLARAMSDPAFVDAIFADAEKALTGFELTTQEIGAFKGMSRAGFEAYAKASPEERKSMWGMSSGAGV